MNEPKRYWVIAHGAFGEMEQFEAVDGGFVLHADYALLKSEVERLDTLCKKLNRQHSDISCDNIMLTKAGDDMARHYQDVVRNEWGQMTTHVAPSIVRWNAAKKGKSK